MDIDIEIIGGWVRIDSCPMTVDKDGNYQPGGTYVTKYCERDGYSREYTPPAVILVYHEESPWWKFW